MYMYLHRYYSYAITSNNFDRRMPYLDLQSYMFILCNSKLTLYTFRFDISY